MQNLSFVPIFNFLQMRFFTASLVLLFTQACWAQFPYVGSDFTAPYADLDNPTTLDIEAGWDDPELTFTLPFVFYFAGAPMTELNLGGVGEMVYAFDENGLISVLWPLNIDVMDVNYQLEEEFSTIRHQVDGTAPDRIFKMEWNNVGLYEELTYLETADVRMNYQMWLYEADGMIEFRFGPGSFGEEWLNEYNLTSGIITDLDYNSYLGNVYTASGDPSAPQWSVNDSFESWYYGDGFLNGTPESGQGYRFTQVSTEIVYADQAAVDMFQIWPNPNTGSFSVANQSNDRQQMHLLDAQGKTIQSWVMAPDSQTPVACEACSPGLYFIQNSSGQSQRLVIN